MGNLLRQAREEARLTQEELAEKSGVTRATISAIENGYDKTTAKTLVKLANALEKTVDSIFFIEGV